MIERYSGSVSLRTGRVLLVSELSWCVWLMFVMDRYSGPMAGSEPSSSVRVTRGAPRRATCVIL